MFLIKSPVVKVYVSLTLFLLTEIEFSFKALQTTNKKSEPIKEKVITSAITISSKKLENIDKILIESVSGVFELKL